MPLSKIMQMRLAPLFSQHLLCCLGAACARPQALLVEGELLRLTGAILQVNFFHFVAEEVRIGLAELGLKSLDDLIGRADLLKQRDLQLAKTQGLDLSYIMSFAGATGPSSVRSNQEVRQSHKLSYCETLQGASRAWEKQEP